MSLAPTTASHFHAEAFAQSRALLAAEQRGPSADPCQAGVSLCVPTDLYVPGVRARLRHALFVYVALGIFGIAVGGIIAGALKYHFLTGDGYLAVALPFSFAGFICLFLGTRHERRALRELIGPRFSTSLPSDLNYLHVEDPDTVATLKLVTEDAALLFFHPESRCIQIEGIVARYLIYADDVVSMESRRVNKSQFVFLTYRIGQFPFTLALNPQSIPSELKAQLLHRSALLAKIRDTFALPAA